MSAINIYIRKQEIEEAISKFVASIEGVYIHIYEFSKHLNDMLDG